MRLCGGFTFFSPGLATILHHVYNKEKDKIGEDVIPWQKHLPRV